jgi:hypothetical protein
LPPAEAGLGKEATKRMTNWLKRRGGRNPLNVMLAFVLLYFAVVSILMFSRDSWVSNDKLVILGLLLTIIVTRSLAFLRDWTPFVLLLLGYEYLRGLAPSVGLDVNVWPMIEADRFLFGGTLPTVELQRIFYDPDNLHIYDYAAFFMYAMHFVLPLAFAFFLWLTNRRVFRLFAYSIVALSYLSFLTYVLFPAMPPWMAAELGYIPHVYKVFDDSLAAVSQNGSIPVVYDFLNPNPVAAVPSLHAAWPMLVLLFIVGHYGKRYLPILIYPLAVWLTIVYTGHHYVIDAIAGIAYAALVYYGVMGLAGWRARATEESRAAREAPSVEVG